MRRQKKFGDVLMFRREPWRGRRRRSVGISRFCLLAPLVVLSVAAGLGICVRADDSTAEKPLTATVARQRVGEKVWVQLEVRATKNRLDKRGEIYLDGELDFRDPKNLAIVISRDGARSLREQGIADAAEHFRDKTVLVHGKVTVQDDVPRVVIEEASQIRVVDPK